jgi:hypothetical protein
MMLVSTWKCNTRLRPRPDGETKHHITEQASPLDFLKQQFEILQPILPVNQILRQILQVLIHKQRCLWDCLRKMDELMRYEACHA